MMELKFLRKSLSAYSSIASIDSNRVGEISEDRSAIIGCNNWCFIYEGGNDYRNAYNDRCLSVTGDAWFDLIEKRRSVCDILGIKFIQLIIPNKATLMPENFPESLGDGITTLLQDLINISSLDSLFCPIEEMKKPELRDSIFRRNDSHMTISGNALLSALLLDKIGVDLGSVPHVEVVEVKHVGDLGSKFKDLIPEIVYAPKFDSGFLSQERIEKVTDISLGGLIGVRQSFLNPCAPIKKKLLVFGNSFFERVPSWGMSPFFTSAFYSYDFLWMPNFDINIIRVIRPDIVICQTVERFMNKLPTDVLT